MNSQSRGQVEAVPAGRTIVKRAGGDFGAWHLRIEVADIGSGLTVQGIERVGVLVGNAGSGRSRCPWLGRVRAVVFASIILAMVLAVIFAMVAAVILASIFASIFAVVLSVVFVPVIVVAILVMILAVVVFAAVIVAFALVTVVLVPVTAVMVLIFVSVMVTILVSWLGELPVVELRWAPAVAGRRVRVPLGRSPMLGLVLVIAVLVILVAGLASGLSVVRVVVASAVGELAGADRQNWIDLAMGTYLTFRSDLAVGPVSLGRRSGLVLASLAIMTIVFVTAMMVLGWTWVVVPLRGSCCLVLVLLRRIPLLVGVDCRHKRTGKAKKRVSFDHVL